MIKTEILESGLIRTHSDKGMKILQETGVVYDEAIDIPGSGHTYTETNQPIEEEITDTEALNILLGRNNDEQVGSNETA